MKPSFNVLTDGWIPVVDMEGNHKLLGIKEATTQAHNLREISDVSPMREYAIYRFWGVFLMDALRPQTGNEMRQLLKNGKFREEDIEKYISVCQEEGVSFDLFDEKRPFMQTPFRAEWDKTKKPVSTLDYTIPNGNNHTHFDHRNNTEIVFSYGEAFQSLLAAQVFCTSGAQGYPSGVNGAPPYFTLIRGKNLFQTLVYSMIAKESIKFFDDIPVFWRNQHIVVEPKKEIVHTSYLYGMLFPARRILLIPDEKTQTVKSVYFSQGLNYTQKDHWTDPHVTYYESKQKQRCTCKPICEKLKRGKNECLGLSFVKPIWQNLNHFIGENKSWIFSQYIKLKDYVVNHGGYVSLTVYGVRTSQASYLTEVRQDFDIPEVMFQDIDFSLAVEDAIKTAESIGSALYLSLTHKELPPQIAAQALYDFYDKCGMRLLGLCDDLAREDADFEVCSRKWFEQVLDPCARRAYKQALEQCTLRGKALMQVTKQQGILFAELSKIRKENQKNG